MKSLDFGRYVLSISATALLLAACGGAQPPVGASDATPQSSAIATQPARGGSWMLPGAKGRDLLYITKPFYPGTRGVYVYTYPHARLIGIIVGLGFSEGECVDKDRNVFVVDDVASNSVVYEYPHGDTSPIATVDVPFEGATGCSIDLSSETLAVSGGGSNDAVSTFAHNPKRGWRFPKTFSVPGMSHSFSCGYDSNGNLYVDGVNQSRAFELAELPHGGNKLKQITLNQSISAPGQVQWDGQHVAVGDPGVSIIYEFSISGSSGSETGSTSLGGGDNVEQFWIQGNTVIGPSVDGGTVGLWAYPGGGNPQKTITLEEPFGAVVSLAR